MCCSIEDECDGVIFMVMECLWVVGGVSSSECGSIVCGEDVRRRKNGGTISVPCAVVLKSLYRVNVSCNSALLVGQCPVSLNFII